VNLVSLYQLFTKLGVTALTPKDNNKSNRCTLMIERVAYVALFFIGIKLLLNTAHCKGMTIDTLTVLEER
jgi:hypothetical protein